MPPSCAHCHLLTSALFSVGLLWLCVRCRPLAASASCAAFAHDYHGYGDHRLLCYRCGSVLVSEPATVPQD